MKRHFQLILEALLSVFILVDVLLLSLMTVGFIVDIKITTIYSISIFRFNSCITNITGFNIL